MHDKKLAERGLGRQKRLPHGVVPEVIDVPKEGSKMLGRFAAWAAQRRVANQEYEQGETAKNAEIAARIKVENELGRTDAIQSALLKSKDRSGVLESRGLYTSSAANRKSLAVEETVDGGSLELSHIIKAGRTFFGTIWKRDANGTIQEASVVRLPFGINRYSESGIDHCSPVGNLGTVVFPDNLPYGGKDRKSFEIGRNNPGDDDDTIMSRSHCAITLDKDGGVAVRDKGSTNGTIVLGSEQFESKAGRDWALYSILNEVQQVPEIWAA